MNNSKQNNNLLSVEMLEEVDNCETSFVAKKQYLLSKIIDWIVS